MKMTIDEIIDNLEFQKQAKKAFSDGSFENQAIEYLKELKHHRAAIRTHGECTVRELIFRLLQLNVDQPISLMDKDCYSQSIEIGAGDKEYYIYGGKGYFED